MATDHAYFNALRALPTCQYAYALRTQAEIDACAHGGADHATATYDPVMDACRLTVPDRIVVDGSHVGVQSSLHPQIWCPMSLADRGQHVIIWDWRAAASWSAENGFVTHKAWMVRRSGSAGPVLWLEPDHDYMAGRTRHSRVRPYAHNNLPPELAYGPPPQTIRGPFKVYSADGDRLESGRRYSQYNADSLGPVQANVYCGVNEWIRKMLVLNQRDDGWVETSFYVCSESVPVTCVLDKVLIGMLTTDRPVVFAYHLNDSFLRARDGTPEEMAAIEPAVSWGRNVTIHRGVVNPLALLQQPDHEASIPWRPRPPSKPLAVA